MIRILLIRLSWICLASGLISCGSGSDTTRPRSHTVIIKGMQFQPSELKVTKGDTVQFKNEDMVTHNIVEASSKKWASDFLNTGQTWKLVINQSADYYCSIHPVMKGKIVVQ